MVDLSNNERAAWGPHDWPDPEIRFRLGTLEVRFSKSSSDVSTSFSYSEDVYWQDPDNWLSEWRTALASSPEKIELIPTSPNREVVARPVRDLYIPAKSETTIYVGYPSWVQVKVSDAVVLADLATELMSDTWLGPNTRGGKVAYATPTQARLQYLNLPDQPHIIRTPVNIQNDSDAQLHISRLSIPAPELTTYLADGRLWSQTVVIHCDADLSEATVDISPLPPGFIEAPVVASRPRRTESGSSVRKAIGFLLG